MSEIVTIGLDIAKNVFQVHRVDGTGGVVVRRKLRPRVTYSAKSTAVLR